VKDFDRRQYNEPMDTLYMVVDKKLFPTTAVGCSTYRTIRAAASYRENPTDYVVAVDGDTWRTRPLNPEEEIEYERLLRT